ncbi:peroxiredoxin Q/BCP/ antioxidant, AhpC/TSA family [Babesia microti strain RI]|uniref:Peroxiredoxin Q/BCP/ antioxidant, AhpC/TSA family n=2 Tax=Babesia microti TaxID=5868 RepID=I7I8K0_BABMR|nr:peroxiredoxin Q/BCP/ antioxidant, AhpC/TSA family [Babesia microti strain RI]ATP62008.1 2-Cys peroxiredoxin 2 [Babesia microti]CCF73243.1 peroxiredoxin Q/BCP/ antioxidant, AhpC/TSA family [Babesia microti strain RI]|eukprot:XP_012647852.1 peroxiredoxin Q/BCP/ antioxidant, AhpC/TSA family [Babesia microti strain RI]
MRYITLLSTLARNSNRIIHNSLKFKRYHTFTLQTRRFSTDDDYIDKYLEIYGTYLIGKKAPDFTKSAVLSNGEITNLNFKEYKGGDMAVILFYPLDFTFVCPSELLAFAKREEEFKSRGVKLLAVSVDSAFAHQAWKKLPLTSGGIPNVGFPLISDSDHSLATTYGVLREDGFCNRATVIVNNEGNVVHYAANDLFLGRSVDETLRLIDGIKFHQENGNVCPADWKKGNKGMAADAKSTASYLNEAFGQTS